MATPSEYQDIIAVDSVLSLARMCPTLGALRRLPTGTIYKGYGIYWRKIISGFGTAQLLTIYPVDKSLPMSTLPADLKYRTAANSARVSVISTGSVYEYEAKWEVWWLVWTPPQDLRHYEWSTPIAVSYHPVVPSIGDLRHTPVRGHKVVVVEDQSKAYQYNGMGGWEAVSPPDEEVIRPHENKIPDVPGHRVASKYDLLTLKQHEDTAVFVDSELRYRQYKKGIWTIYPHRVIPWLDAESPPPKTKDAAKIEQGFSGVILLGNDDTMYTKKEVQKIVESALQNKMQETAEKPPLDKSKPKMPRRFDGSIKRKFRKGE